MMKNVIDEETGLIYRFYPLEKQLLINKKITKEVAIWDHYQFNHGGYINDETILGFIKELHNIDYSFHRENLLKENERRWKTYKYEHFYQKEESKNHRAYCLIWYLQEDKEVLFVLNCYRTKSHDKNKSLKNSQSKINSEHLTSKRSFEKYWKNLTQTEIFYKTIEEDERELRTEKNVSKEKTKTISNPKVRRSFKK